FREAHTNPRQNAAIDVSPANPPFLSLKQPPPHPHPIADLLDSRPMLDHADARCRIATILWPQMRSRLARAATRAGIRAWCFSFDGFATDLAPQTAESVLDRGESRPHSNGRKLDPRTR